MRLLIGAGMAGLLVVGLMAQAQIPTSPDMTPNIPPLASPSVTEVKNFGEIVEKKSVIRVVDKELGTVCYVAHGASYDSGVGIHCIPMPAQ